MLISSFGFLELDGREVISSTILLRFLFIVFVEQRITFTLSEVLHICCAMKIEKNNVDDVISNENRKEQE
jgi:hypothetical protein